MNYNLCLTNSYKNTPQATETFKDYDTDLVVVI